MRFRSVKLGGAVLVALSLAACSSTSPGTSGVNSQSAAPAEIKGGVAVIAISDEPDVLDPSFSSTFVGREVFSSFCEKLYDTNESLEIVPQLATELPEISEDGLTVTIKLRDGVKFNDGTSFDAEAVKTTLERNKTNERSALKSDLEVLDKVEVVDPLTVQLTLNSPSGSLGALLADTGGMIMSPAVLEELGDDFGTAPVCVGPFQFKDRVAGSEIDLVKSDLYYDADKVKLDGVTYKFITDPNVRAANLQSGDINVADQMNVSDALKLQDTPGIEIQKVASIAYKALVINVDPNKTDGILAKSVELRKAFELSLNRDAINEVVYQGQSVPDCIPLPTSSKFRPADLECRAFDPDAARKIIEASGETLPIPVEFMISARPTDQKVGEVIQSMANAVGFDVTLKPVEFVTSLAAARSGDYEMFLNGFSGRIDPDGFLTRRLNTGGTNNYSQYSDAETDQLIADAAGSSDVAVRSDLYAQLFDRLAETVPAIYLYHDSWFLGLTGITGVGFSSDAIPRFKTASLTE